MIILIKSVWQKKEIPREAEGDAVDVVSESFSGSPAIPVALISWSLYDTQRAAAIGCLLYSGESMAAK